MKVRKIKQITGKYQLTADKYNSTVWSIDAGYLWELNHNILGNNDLFTTIRLKAYNFRIENVYFYKQSTMEAF